MKTIMLVGLLLVASITFGQTNEDSETQVNWVVKCYPNPTSDLLMISSTNEIKDVTLIDLNGSVIKAPAMPNWCFSLHDLPQGWIFVFIEDVNGNILKKNIFKN